jgi:uncharacterized protein (TIGR03118 family)
MDKETSWLRSAAACATFAVLAGTAAAHDNDRQAYSNEVLVSNGAIPAAFTDPNLINGWGVAFNPTGFVWVSDADSGKSTLYDGTGMPQALIVSIPGPNGTVGHPTGIVFSGGADFVVSNGTTNGPARFLFATEEGTIAGWAPNVNATNAFTAVPNASGMAVYTGLALSGNGTTHLLYAANFRSGRVDVFDGTFAPVQVDGAFRDPRLPHGYSPFGIQAIGGDIYVTYAKQDDSGDEEIQGPGLGFVNVFDPDGHLIRRVATRGVLNAPWGLALAPASFGEFAGALLVGNLGNGRINAFGTRTGRFLGTLRGVDRRAIHVDGLWGIAFGNGIQQQQTNALFYASGPNDEEDGAYGVIRVVNGK